MVDVTSSARGVSRRVGTGVALALPLAGLALLLTRPQLDVRWEHHPSHFWLVLVTAWLSAVVAYGTGVAADRRGDARVLFVSLTFLASAGFLGLHALATPGVLLESPNSGFVVATPFGIAIGSVLAAVSSFDLGASRSVAAVRTGRRIRVALLAVMVLWAVVSLAGLQALQGSAESAEPWSVALAVPGIALYGVAAARYVRLWQATRSIVVLTMMSAFVLLAEALVAIVFARSWQLSWWEWHVLLMVAFGLVATGAQVSWHEERFADLYQPETREMSVLFADLQGFTTFSESHEPAEVTAMLNEYFSVAVPRVVQQYGGVVDRIIGDALMVTFNRRGDQPDHAHRAAAAGLELQRATATVVEAHPEWPRFRVGINSGPVLLGPLGTRGGRTDTIIGDTVNTASRIEGKAPAGGVAIGPATKSLLPNAETAPLGRIQLKGKVEPVEVYMLRSLAPA